MPRVEERHSIIYNQNILEDRTYELEEQLDHLRNKTRESIDDVMMAISNETSRAINAENIIANDLATEIARSTSNDAGLSTSLAEEINRATAAEAALSSNITAEVTRATSAEGELSTNLAAEVTRATAAEGILSSNITAEVTRATAAEAALSSNITTEVTRATSAEYLLSTAISEEITRATSAEGSINAIIGSTSLDSLGSHSTLTDAVALMATAGLTPNSLFETTEKTVTFSKFFKSFIICSNLEVTEDKTMPYSISTLLDLDFRYSMSWENEGGLESCLSACSPIYKPDTTTCAQKLLCIAANMHESCRYSRCNQDTFKYLNNYGGDSESPSIIGAMLAGAVANELC